MKLFALLPILVAAAIAKADIPAVHGMLVFGQKTVYASHLPMFHQPHDYQLVMQIKLSPGSAQSQYHALQAAGQTLFTIAPKPMDLSLVMTGLVTEFPADLYHGHFERGGKNLGSVMVSVEKFVINAKLNPKALDFNEYMLFGAEGEYFAVHIIAGKPSFDFVASIAKPHRLCDELEDIPLKDGVLPVRVGSTSARTKIPDAEDSLGSVGGIAADILKVIYVEEAELAH